MKEPERIERILDLLFEIWSKDKDMRFMQLIYNIQRSYSCQNDDVGLIQKKHDDGFCEQGFDLFSLEDKQIEPFLSEYLQKLLLLYSGS